MINAFKVLLLTSLTLASLSACSILRTHTQGTRLSQIRSQIADTVVIDKEIERQSLKDYLAREDLVRSIRVVEIFERERPGSASALKEYRLFNISEHSVYHYLGLQNADVLVAASDVIVAAPELFKDYVRLLAFENEATIEIRREGKPLILRFKIKD